MATSLIWDWDELMREGCPSGVQERWRDSRLAFDVTCGTAKVEVGEVDDRDSTPYAECRTCGWDHRFRSPEKALEIARKHALECGRSD